jgi:iron-sulfur cluster repair protein YtfE (RIC family)
MLRRDLETVRGLARDVSGGLEATQIEQQVGELQTNSPLWKFRANCLYFCRFVHTHHSIEDYAFFPAIRRSDPEMEPVVDRLEADHRLIATHIESVNQTTRELLNADSHENREKTVVALNELAEHLLEHLRFEEDAIGPTVQSWEQLPFG